MAFNMKHRAMLVSNLVQRNKIETDDDENKIFTTCGPCIRSQCLPSCMPITSPAANSKTNHLSPLVIILIVALSISFLIIIYYAILSKYSTRLNRAISRTFSRRRSPETTQEEFLQEHLHGHVVDHPIWLINRVGLDAVTINMIPVFKYRKEDAVVDGTECSVCLSEFEEDEMLRLLPKCSHAFHLECIDTWLRSNISCPLCRAPIMAKPPVQEAVVEASEGLVVSEELILRSETSTEEDQVDHDEAEEGVDSFAVVDATKTPAELTLNEVAERGKQPMRRSISMDSLSVASMFCFSVGNSLPVEDGEPSSSDSQAKKMLNSGAPSAKTGRTQSMSWIPEGSVPLKRTVSSGGKLFWAKYSRSRNSSILPL